MFDHLLDSSRRDDSNKWSNIRFGVEIGILEIKIRTLSGALARHKCFTVNDLGKQLRSKSRPHKMWDLILDQNCLTLRSTQP